MQRSSSSIASLAAALAKAQAVLINPEKSLVGTLPPDQSGGTERSFRYASLASGLDIVRKTLGEHEIATVQTTAIDHGAGIVNLTTMLAHSSGEWIASDWPVCPITETATPRRMGAALTYARRYALFTLVGIAGEDDLDAPDLLTPSGRGSAEKTEPPGNGQVTESNGRTRHQGGNGKAKINPRPTLGPGVSGELRERLLAQIAEIGSADDAALWAYCNMRTKNELSAADALQVENAFQSKLAGFPALMESLSASGQDLDAPTIAAAANQDSDADESSSIDAARHPAEAGDTEERAGSSEPSPRPSAKRSRAKRTPPAGPIDKAVLAFPEPRRIRDREHVRFVAKQPCLVCGRVPSDPHHLRFTQSRALGRRVSDEFTVPLCRGHHRELHRCGDEAAWWATVGIEPTAAARALWLETHPLAVAPNDVSLEGVTSPALACDGASDQAAGKPEPSTKTKPIDKAAAPQ